jgi:hypothetical protein
VTYLFVIKVGLQEWVEKSMYEKGGRKGVGGHTRPGFETGCVDQIASDPGLPTTAHLGFGHRKMWSISSLVVP